MVSLKDISAACGVSVATVSKALNDHKDVSAATRERVKKAAIDLGYMPNSAAKALKTNRSYNIGILFVDEAQSGLTHDYYAALLDSFKRCAEAKGYDLTFINCNTTRPNRMSYLAHSRYRGYDGVCIACVDFFTPEVLELVRSSIPIVTIDHVFDNRMVIQSDNVAGMRDLVKYVYSRGHRRIAHIHGLQSAVSQARLSSFYRTTQELGLDIPDAYVREAPFRDSNLTYDLTLELLDLSQPPTCILFQDDYAAYGGMNAIRSRGLRIPEDISVAGYDGIYLSRCLQPHLTTIYQDTETMGAMAAEKLISLIEQPRTTLIEHLLIPGTLMPGQTIAEIPVKE